ncbi:hypothetical protein F4813DRAFT_352365 [Daldinia decipiens]|uniref:uncharacterized protein n=1 Tax=Daldinia decipiens TaxID=326647 RepID=UPI0020C2E956|nr:uncharacterized protein F4813DRAFT_352365 [Daldinia decipiens]KAI1659909.1 hypothetical protein F4813DRAFT_352365 [Daldinia decipiens]
MPPSHRPDLAVYRKLIPIEEWSLRPLMWPYINLEDLSRTEPLLLMLNSRGRYSPSDFINLDLDSVFLGYYTPYYNKVELSGYSMLFREPPSLDTYGQFHFDIDDDVRFNDGSDREVFTPDNGFRILAAQDRLYHFLIRCCEAILHDIPTEDLTQADQPIVRLPAVVIPKSNSPRLRSFAIDSFEELYKRPCRTEFSRIESIVRAMLSAAEDHLMSMREDPDYFRMVLNQREETCPGHLLDINSRGHSFYLQNKDYFREKRIREVFSDAFLIFDVLAVAYDLFSYLHSLFEEWKEDPSQTASLPLSLYKVLYGLYHSLAVVCEKVLDRLRLSESIYSSPALREYFYCEVTDSKDPKGYGSYQVGRRPLVNMPKICTEAVYFLEVIAGLEKRLPIGLEGIFIELELLTQRHCTAKPLVSSWLGAQISVLGVLHECRYVLEQYQHQFQSFSQYCRRYPGEVENFYQSKFEAVFRVYNIPDSFWCDTAGTMRDILTGESKYPIREPRSREVVKKLRETEASFDHFWIKALDQLQRARVLEVCATSVFSRRLRRTEPWEEPQIEQTKSKKKIVGKNTNQLSDEFIRQEISEAGKLANTAKESVNSKMNGSTAEHRIYPFKVDSRTFEVFSTLLFDGPDPSNLGEVSWDDFVHAMLAMDFTAEKLFGSAWQFKPTIGLDSDLSSIIFHEPYMGGKLEYAMIKHYGRRITRTLKWESHMFIRV